MLGNLHKARTTAFARDVSGQSRHLVREVAHVSHPAGVRKITEHRRVIGAVAAKHNSLSSRCEVQPQHLAQKNLGHAQLVEIAEPAVHMDARDLGGGPGCLEQLENTLHSGPGQRRHVLAKVYGQVAFAVGLVGGKGRSRHLLEDAFSQFMQANSVARALGFGGHKSALHPAVASVIGKVKRAVFADHPGHRPQPRNQVAPACGPPGDRHHRNSSPTQRLERRVGTGRKLALGGERVVYVGQNGV